MQKPSASDRRLDSGKPGGTGAARDVLVADSASPTSTSPGGYSRSHLEPVLRAQGTLEKPPGRRKPGRPRIIASWFPKVAEIMADGTCLRTALAMCRVKLSGTEVRACYRNKTLRALYTETRRRYLAEHCGMEPTLRAVIGRYL